MSDKIIKVEVGQTLPPESWFAARDDLAKVFPIIGHWLRNINHEGKGKQDEEEFLAETQLAIQAMTYVGEFAADKCRFIVLPEKGGDHR